MEKKNNQTIKEKIWHAEQVKICKIKWKMKLGMFVRMVEVDKVGDDDTENEQNKGEQLTQGEVRQGEDVQGSEPIGMNNRN